MLFNNIIKYAIRRNTALAAVYAALLAAGCAHNQGGETGGSAKEADETPLTKEYYREDLELLGALPDYVSEYLLGISAAFAAHDSVFLLAQGEAGYEKDVRPFVNDDEYLALLYRAGAYAEDAEWSSPFSVDIDNVSFIDYTDWREHGPVLEIDGIMQMKKGPPLSFSIILLWRLPQPKILGIYP
ncbi:MAG: hypothetical protein LBC27_07165 [Spirochaetaceae bacterium]|jgi:hypothetical protein|nr:hypothetical protein [Spirochaetaceae bacterium]